jgi:hypothetical protein
VGRRLQWVGGLEALESLRLAGCVGELDFLALLADMPASLLTVDLSGKPAYGLDGFRAAGVCARACACVRVRVVVRIGTLNPNLP